jgi:class 3 adenylate cyclase
MARLSARERAALPDRAFAYIDSTGRRRLPIHDEAHLRAAIARFAQVPFESDEARDRARQRLLVAAKRLGIMPVGFIASQVRRERRGQSLPSGAVTFLLFDLEGSTGLLQALGDGYATVLRDVRRIIGTSVTAAGGHKVDATGDEFFAVFVQARDAVAAALAVQVAMSAFTWPGGLPVLVRAGVHGGRPTLTDSGYVGLAVHTVARITSVAHGGQVLVSEQVRGALGDLEAGQSLVHLGGYRLAGLAREEQLYQLVADGLRREFPPLRAR